MVTGHESLKTLAIAAAVTLLAALYTFVNSLYYAWLSAMGAARDVNAGVWAWLNLGITVLFLGLLAYLLVRLRRAMKLRAMEQPHG